MSISPRLVVLPGLDGTGVLLEPFVRALPREAQAIVIAYPPQRMLSLLEHAQWVSERLPHGECVLLAESFSGLVALTLLATAASRFRSVIFVGAFAEPPKPFISRMAPMLPRGGSLLKSIPSFMLRQYCLGPGGTVGQINLVRDALKSVSPEVLSHRLGLVNTRHAFGGGRVAGSCHYVQASADRLVPERCIQWFRQRFPSLSVTRLEGPHFLLLTRPAESARLVMQILAETSGHRGQASGDKKP